MYLVATTVPTMHKGITFLNDVTPSTRQKVLNFVKQWQSNDDWLEVQTSGSTGTPKTIKLHKDKIKASAHATIEFFNLQPNQTVLLALSVDYIAGKMMVIRALEQNMNIVVAPLNSNPLAGDIEEKIHFSAFVPMQVHTILAEEQSKLNYQKIDKVIIGGAPIDFVLEQNIAHLSNMNFATFGMTETISHVALRNINLHEKYYTALPDVKFAKTVNGQLIIEAPKIIENPIVTTDCVELVDEHKFIWKGRTDFVVNSGGVKLHPEEIEKKIEPLLPDHKFYIFGIKDERLGQKLVLKIESKQKVDTQKLKMILQQVLDKYEVPKEIIVEPKFDTTPTGKVMRN